MGYCLFLIETENIYGEVSTAAGDRAGRHIDCFVLFYLCFDFQSWNLSRYSGSFFGAQKVEMDRILQFMPKMLRIRNWVSF